jgi:Holliday junction resolvase-like predicted endonuclease
MSGAATRRKGRVGETTAKELLTARDWVVDDLTSGLATGDLIATDADHNTYLVEVKNCAGITTAHRDQAMRQGKERRLRWMLMSKLAGTKYWVVQRQGGRPVLWSEGVEE